MQVRVVPRLSSKRPGKVRFPMGSRKKQGNLAGDSDRPWFCNQVAPAFSSRARMIGTGLAVGIEAATRRSCFTIGPSADARRVSGKRR